MLSGRILLQKRNLFLHINETPITQWVKEQFGSHALMVESHALAEKSRAVESKTSCFAACGTAFFLL